MLLLPWELTGQIKGMSSFKGYLCGHNIIMYVVNTHGKCPELREGVISGVPLKEISLNIDQLVKP